MLNKEGLKQQIKTAFSNAKAKTEDPEEAIDALSGEIADAIDTYVKQMKITYLTGLTSPSGPVAGTFTYLLS